MGIDGGGAIAAAGCSGSGFIWKNAIAINSTAIHINSMPIITIVRTAPMISSRAAVENKPTCDLVERLFSERRAKKAQIMMKIHRIRNTAIIPSMKGKTSLGPMFVVFGVMPDSEEIVDQLPFQDG